MADRLVREGWSVRARPPDHTVEGKKNPDAVVRRSPDDPGTLTEFKTPQSARDTSVQRAIREAGKQLHPYGGGDVIVDCRPMEISVDDARRGYVRAVGEARQRGAPLPDRVVVILPDDSLVTWERTS